MRLDKRPELHRCWSTNRLFFLPVYGQTTRRDRFLLLLKYLQQQPEDATAIRPLLMKFQEKFEDVYFPQREKGC